MAGKKGKKKEPSELEKLQSDQRQTIRAVFRQAGFHRVTGIADKEFIFEGQKSDFDDVFTFENVIVFAEYTCRQSDGVGEHLKLKKIIYDKVLANPDGFLEYLRTKFPASAEQLTFKYHSSKIVTRILYCSRYDFEQKYKTNVPGPVYLDYPALRYFFSLVDAIRQSARHELFQFLNIAPQDVGTNGKIQIATSSNDYRGLILPEAHSNFTEGFKVITIYVDPEALLRTSYVLRKHGWRDTLNLYQRMISKTKIENIRTYLKTQKRVFVNNIIVTLPPEVKPLDSEGNTLDVLALNDTAPVVVKLPDRPNTVGIIDGQHRIYAYHETAEDDPKIAELRVQQNLLVTGIIFPEDMSEGDREKFQARLFLEINSTQTNPKSDLKQHIGLVLEPFSNDSIATRVLNGLARSGPLAGFVQQYFYETDKLKPTSVISYGLKPLVKSSGTDSIFAIWADPRAAAVADGSDVAALDDYVSFCVSTINLILTAVRKNIGKKRWVTNPKVEGRVLATTYVNSFLILARLLIERGIQLEQSSLETSLAGLQNFDFSAYHSSQYKRMAEKMVEIHFPVSPPAATPSDSADAEDQ